MQIFVDFLFFVSDPHTVDQYFLTLLMIIKKDYMLRLEKLYINSACKKGNCPFGC